MRALVAALVPCVAWTGISRAAEENLEEPDFSNIVKASLVFREDFDPSRRYPHILNVFLRLENVHDAAVTWTADSITGIEAELLDATGKLVPTPPQAVSLPSSNYHFLLPFGSRYDWLVSHGGVAMMGDAEDQYVLVVGGRGWFVPKESLSDYSLRIRLRGAAWRSVENQVERQLLVEVPPARIDLPEASKVVVAGPWSKPIADARGYAVRGRLVLREKLVGDERREVAIYVELEDASGFVGESMRLFCEMSKTDFRPDHKGGLHCELRDKDNRFVEPKSYPFGGTTPRSEWVTLPTDGAIRLRASPFGVHRPGAMAITPHLNKLWVISDDDPNEYFLSATFTVDPTRGNDASGDGHVWRGTVELPAVRIVGRTPERCR